MDINTARTVLTWIFAVFFGLLAATILGLIWKGRINLALLISEKDGAASMSRFQMMVFTFVVAISLYLIVVSDPATFPDIPAGVLGLLGISTGTYAVSKGIQMSAASAASSNAGTGGSGGATAASQSAAAGGRTSPASQGAVIGAITSASAAAVQPQNLSG